MIPFTRYLQCIFAGFVILLAEPLGSFAQIQLSSPPASIASTVGPTETNVQPIELRAALIKTDNYPIDLATVLKLAADQNLAIAQSQKNTEVLQSRLRQSQVSVLPSITGSLSENWQYGQQGFISGSNGGFIGGNSGGTASVSSGSSRRGKSSGGSQHFLQTQLGASWTIYPGGRNLYQILAAKRRKVSADYLLKETYQEQLSNAAQDYYKLLAAYQQKGVVIRSIINAQEQVKLNQAKVKVGKGLPLDLSQAKTNYAQQQSNLVQTESAILTAEQNLLDRLNLDPTIHLVPNEMDSIKRPLVPDILGVNRLIAQAISVNPSILSGAEDLKALGYDYKVVRSDLIPSITLNTSVRGSGSEISAMQRSESIGFTINTTLLQNMGLLVPYQMQERKKLIEQKILSQKQLVRDVQTQVMTAFLNSENYDNAITAAEQAVASAEESYALAKGRFEAGYGVYLDVLNADAQLATARNTLAQAVLNYNQAQVQLLQAVGLASPSTLSQGLQLQGNSKDGQSTTKTP
jgi:outer membrane protein TolC